MSPDENNIPQGRKGGLVGGPARARALTPERRSEIARKAAEVRAQKLSPERRSEIARMGARALWGVGYDGMTFDSGWHGGHDESN